ncbi:acyl-CoA carboxylase subunit epsilon [Streptomyces sp. NPDC053493]|uniref:acyl-CoA carboxylase subunit epsilon n=1 Tax=Streptomyces sp. NPDC053493 TaxID=3365705 RepID=UPI0037D523A9
MDEATEKPPAFVVVRGRPDADELAAVTAVLLARLRAPGAAEVPGEAADTPPKASWGAPRRARPRVGWTASA